MTAIRQSALLTGLAQYLAAGQVGAWRPTGTYSADEQAIVLKQLPAGPDTAVALSVYSVLDDIRLPDVQVRVQLRFRAAGPRTAVDDFADDVFDLLHGRHMIPAGDLLIQQARRISSIPLGADENGRQERADNYELILMRPNLQTQAHTKEA